MFRTEIIARPADVVVEISTRPPGRLCRRALSTRLATRLLEEELFGKRILVTDKPKGHAPIAVVVADYRSQEASEADFRQMKDPKVVSFSPMFHFSHRDHRVTSNV